MKTRDLVSQSLKDSMIEDAGKDIGQYIAYIFDTGLYTGKGQQIWIDPYEYDNITKEKPVIEPKDELVEYLKSRLHK